MTVLRRARESLRSHDPLGRPVLVVEDDAGLPGMDGFAVAEHLAPDVPVLVVTGDPLRAELRAHGRFEELQVLGKPVTLDRFEEAVRELV